MRPEAVHWGLAPVAFSWGRGGQDIPHPLAGPRMLYAWVGTQGPPHGALPKHGPDQGSPGVSAERKFHLLLASTFQLLS